MGGNVVSKLPIVEICGLNMVQANYRYSVPNGKPPGYVYRITASPAGKKSRAQFDVGQKDADQFADELIALAALIRAHRPDRKEQL
jgi:hypothetical protein